MTSQPSEQQEPSMEEILSSIRRIIADEATEEDGEDESERRGGGTLADRTLATGVDRAPDALVLAEPGGDRDGDETDDDADQDVLELTEVVRESAEVIDLEVGVTPPAPVEPQALAPDPPVQELGSGEPDAPEDQTSQGDQRAGPGAPSVDEPDEPSPTGWSRPVPPGGDHPSSNIAGIRNHDMANHETALQTSSNGMDPLVSDQAAGAATGAFAKLSQAVQRTPAELAIADDSGRTTEQFVEDMMRPMLRDWLDQNLPTMVERIVQKEIQKIVRRAED